MPHFKSRIRQLIHTIAEEYVDHYRFGKEYYTTDDEGNFHLDMELVFCSKCFKNKVKKGNDLVACDGKGCGRVYHQQCLDPILECIDDEEEEEWYCWQCECLRDCYHAINETNNSLSSSSSSSSPSSIMEVSLPSHVYPETTHLQTQGKGSEGNLPPSPYDVYFEEIVGRGRDEVMKEDKEEEMEEEEEDEEWEIGSHHHHPGSSSSSKTSSSSDSDSSDSEEDSSSSEESEKDESEKKEDEKVEEESEKEEKEEDFKGEVSWLLRDMNEKEEDIYVTFHNFNQETDDDEIITKKKKRKRVVTRSQSTTISSSSILTSPHPHSSSHSSDDIEMNNEENMMNGGVLDELMGIKGREVAIPLLGTLHVGKVINIIQVQTPSNNSKEEQQEKVNEPTNHHQNNIIHTSNSSQNQYNSTPDSSSSSSSLVIWEVEIIIKPIKSKKKKTVHKILQLSFYEIQKAIQDYDHMKIIHQKRESQSILSSQMTNLGSFSSNNILPNKRRRTKVDYVALAQIMFSDKEDSDPEALI